MYTQNVSAIMPLYSNCQKHIKLSKAVENNMLKAVCLCSISGDCRKPGSSNYILHRNNITRGTQWLQPLSNPSRPMSVAVKDWTGDGADDVICFWHKPGPGLKADWQSLADVAVQLRDGRTGKVLREAAPKAITKRRRKDPVGANWVHQRLLIANFRGTPEPRDLAVKLGDL